MNSIDKFKNCSNCKKSYEMYMYISSRSTTENTIYTKVCEKCRQKNKTSNIKKKDKVKKEIDNHPIVCNNCNISYTDEHFASKTGKRVLKVCSYCRNPEKNKKLKKKCETLYDNKIDSHQLGKKFICNGCKKEFIKCNLFSCVDRSMCNNCIIYSSS